MAGLAAQQAGREFQAAQFGANLAQQQALARAQAEQQRQINQASEIFRAQGASNQQALDLAERAFNQRLRSRQLALGELGAQQQLQRQPLEDLFRLFAFSTGATPGQAAQPGLLQGLAPGIGAALGQRIFR